MEELRDRNGGKGICLARPTASLVEKGRQRIRQMMQATGRHHFAFRYSGGRRSSKAAEILNYSLSILTCEGWDEISSKEVEDFLGKIETGEEIFTRSGSIIDRLPEKEKEAYIGIRTRVIFHLYFDRHMNEREIADHLKTSWMTVNCYTRALKVWYAELYRATASSDVFLGEYLYYTDFFIKKLIAKESWGEAAKLLNRAAEVMLETGLLTRVPRKNLNANITVASDKEEVNPEKMSEKELFEYRRKLDNDLSRLKTVFGSPVAAAELACGKGGDTAGMPEEVGPVRGVCDEGLPDGGEREVEGVSEEMASGVGA